ncbi:MAG: NADH:flavin oxidoreductase/NADH oxidase [Massilibacillus sp.]|jgi:2,4-dienoyl-CoA reductase-like NADH-dependent reductase (Old Yellow Enzyme family)|nr:NADH:flavin oxidoreductase/NADH oxidase [Massilibacillus sp.]
MAKILEEIHLKHMKIKNRIVRSATHCFLGTKEGAMTEAEYAMYQELAANDVGLIITGHCSVSPTGMANEDQTAIYDDAFIPQLKKLHTLVSKYGAKVVAQINHAGPRAVNHEDLAGVSAAELKKGKVARELTIEEIAQIKTEFINAAYRVKQSGLDGVQLHVAHSYLLSQFIDTTFNHRTDAYGGTVENRFRLIREIVVGIKEKCGEEFPLFIKINNDSRTDDLAYEQDLLYMLQELAKLGVEAVELSGVDFISQPRTATNYYVERITKIKKAVPELPIILVGGVRSLADMDQVLESGIDMVSLSRPFICEPDIIQRLLNGQEKSKCLNCSKCFALPRIKPGIRCVLKRK